MDDLCKKVFDSASDLAKQLITLSTGIVTVSLLFSNSTQFPRHNGLAKAAWISYLVSTLAGIWSLMALTGTLTEALDKSIANPKLGANARIPAAVQIFAFGLAALFTLLFVVFTY